MATVDVLLQNARISGKDKLSKHQLRDKGFERAFLKIAGIDSDSVLGRANDRNSARYALEQVHEDRPSEIIVTSEYGVTKKVARSCTIDCSGENSATRKSITYTPLVYDMCIDMSEFPNFGSEEEMVSHLGFQEVFLGLVMKIEEGMRNDKNELAKAAIIAAKTPATAYQGAKFATTGDALNIPKASELDLMSEVEYQMLANGFNTSGGFYVASQLLGLNSYRRQTAGNIQFKGDEITGGDEGWQWDRKTIAFDHSLAGVVGADYRGFAIMPNSIGHLTQIPLAMRQERVIYSSPMPMGGRRFGNMLLPTFGEKVGYYMDMDCSDGKAMTLKAQLSVNYATVTAHNSDLANNASGILEYLLLSA